MSTNSNPNLSIIIPCHNEAGSIARCINTARNACADTRISIEIIVVDNMSSDGTANIARAHGVRVITEKRVGYGNALRRGFAEARGDTIAFGDGDGTYDFSELPRFLTLVQDADFVTGERRYIKPGAMPFLHRYVGRPLFAFAIRHLFGVPVHDSHSGFGIIKKSALQKLPLKSTGMEFASEILITAHRRGVRIVSAPISYYPRTGTSKLRTFRDGLRHLYYMGTSFRSA